LIRAQTLCIQIYSNSCSDHNLSFKIYFRMNPIAVAFFYCNLSSSITSQISWTTSQLFRFKYENWSISPIWLILFLFNMVLSTIVSPMIISSYQSSSWHHLDPYHVYLNQSYLAHIYSNYNWVIWVRCVATQLSVLLLLMWCWYTLLHSTYPYSMYPIESWIKFSNIIHSNQILYLLILVDHYWTIQFANELTE
jgi:hypothetical protein